MNVRALLLVSASALAVLILPNISVSQPPPGKGKPGGPPSSAPSFTDSLTGYDTSLWRKADGWANGPPFDNGWKASAVQFDAGAMSIQLDDEPSSGEPFTSGELRTIDYYGYGCYEVGMKPVAESGAVTAFFTFAGPFDTPTGGNGRHNENDIEFLGNDTTRLQVNFWTNDDAYAGGHEHIIPLAFDAADAFHDYAFKWTSNSITWNVDGVQVHQVLDSSADPTPKTSDTTHKIMMNLWAVDETAASWAGQFNYPGAPLTADYDWVQLTEGEDCVVGDGSGSPPPPPETGDMHIDSIGMALTSRDRQAVASIRVVDANGQAVGNADVDGEWSGLVSDGDQHRTTDSDGTAVFYSRRNRGGSGTFIFCVTDVTKSGVTYEDESNVETCDSVAK